MLDHTAQAELEHRYQTTRDAATRTRYQMVLLRAEGRPVVEVARITRRSHDTVRRVLKRYLSGGPDAVPDATLAEDLFPEDLPRLLGLLGHADLYLQDEVEVALHPTLTRVWSRAGRAGQRLVQAPGKNFKRCGFGLVDWRDGHLDFQLADGRRAVPLPAPARAAGSPW